MSLAIQVQILDKAVWISLHTNALGEDKNLSVISPFMGK